MENVVQILKHAFHIRSGPLLCATLDPVAPPSDPYRWSNFFNSANPSSISQIFRSALSSRANVELRLSKSESNAWVEVYVSYWKAIGQILATERADHPRWNDVFEAWKEVANALIRGFNSAGFEAWTVPCLYIIGRYLRVFAIKADENSKTVGLLGAAKALQDDMVSDFAVNERLEEAARVINRIFTLCISDRAPLAESRKWGLYHTVNLLFKTYFKLNSIGLSKNILRALQASRTDLPSLDAFPKSHVVTFKYYVGVIHFLEEDYVQAEENLTDAWALCLPTSGRNKELILTYLIPCHLLTTHTLPTTSLLAPFPRLDSLFTRLSHCIKKGDLAGYDAAIATGEDEFVKRRIYLTLERGRDIALRNLLRKVYLAGGFEDPLDGAPPRRRTRIPVAEFGAAICLGSQVQVGRLQTDEVECLLANMIYKNLMKGYISRERGIVVLSKGSAFPGTGL